MVRWLISFATVAVAVIVQLTIVDRIAFPGGTGPDLVLLVVAALALAGGPLAGTVIGFSAGLALDVAPPGSHLVGQNALVFCLVGYFCGLAAESPSSDGVPEQGHTALFEIVVTAAGAVAGEVLAVGLSLMLSDPRVTWPAVKHVLPVAVVYDVVLAPFVLFAVAAALRLAGRPGERDRTAWSAVPARAPAPSAVRQMSGANTPRLRLSERAKGQGWVGGARGALAHSTGGRPAARREPRLNLARSSPDRGGSPNRGRPAAKREPRLNMARSRSLSRGRPVARGTLGAAFATGGLGGAPVKVKFASRRYEGVLGGSWLGAMSTTSGLAGSRLTSSRFGRSRMGRSLFGGSVFSRSPSALKRSTPVTRSAPLVRSSFLGRSSLLGRTSWLSRPSSLGGSGRSLGPTAGGTTGHAPRFSRGSSLGWLTAALRRPARPSSTLQKSPGRGWLRRTSSGSRATGRRAMGRRAIGRGTFGRPSSKTVIGRGRTGNRTPRLRMPRPRSKRKWRTGGYR